MRATRVCALVTVSILGALPVVVGAGTPAGATFAGPNGKIAFSSRVADNTTEIFSIDPDGSTLRQLTFAPGFDADPAWSPDGTRIAYARDDGVFVMNADGTGSTRLTLGRDAHPAWSPDGSKLVFQRRVATDFDLYVVAADGTGETALTGDPDTDDAVPSWSPDGQRIAFSRSPRFAGQPDIHVVNTDGSGLVRLTTGGQSGDPDWSPDGTRFVFTRGQLSFSDIYVMNVDGSNPIQITAAAGNDQMPEWSPDGQRITFQSQGSSTGISKLRVMNADGSEQTSLEVSGAFPDWGTSPTEPDCSDGLDNDGDGKVDFPADPGCAGPDGADERDRKGAFSCRATALRAAGGETAVANPPNEPCADDFEEVQGVHVLGPPDTIDASTLTASTDSRPDIPAGILPAAGDHGEAEAAVEKVVIRSGLGTITAWVVRAEADVTCRGTPLAPVLSSSSSIAALRISGAPVAVGSSAVDIPLGSATLRLNHTTTGSNEIVQRALWLDTGDPAQDIVVAEARADYSENPCA